MLTPGVYLRNAFLQRWHLHRRFDDDFRKTKWNKSGPQNYAILSIIGISADILLS